MKRNKSFMFKHIYEKDLNIGNKYIPLPILPGWWTRYVNVNILFVLAAPPFFWYPSGVAGVWEQL